MKTAAKIFDVIALVLTWAAILAAGVLLVPRIFGIMPYIVQSGSMEPVIHTGSVVYINMSDRDLEANRIMAYELQNGTVVVHRAVSYNEETGGWVMKGDANDLPDAIPVGLEQVKGAYLFSIPVAGYILAAFEQTTISIFGYPVPAASFFLIGFILLFNLAAYFCNAFAEDEKRPELKK